jgi:hypothetical protein
MTPNRKPKGTIDGGQFAATSNPEAAVDLVEVGSFAPWAITRDNVSEALRNAAAIVERICGRQGDRNDFAQVGEIIGYSREIAEQEAATGDLYEWLDELNTKADYLGHVGVSTPQGEAIAAGLVSDLKGAADQLGAAREQL